METKTYAMIVALIFSSLGCGKNNSTEPNNNPPEITSITATPPSISPYDSAKIVCIADDKDGDKLRYFWQVKAGSIIGSKDSVIWIPPKTDGSYSVMCEVLDGNGGVDEDSVEIKVETIIIMGVITTHII